MRFLAACTGLNNATNSGVYGRRSFPNRPLRPRAPFLKERSPLLPRCLSCPHVSPARGVRNRFAGVTSTAHPEPSVAKLFWSLHETSTQIQGQIQRHLSTQVLRSQSQFEEGLPQVVFRKRRKGRGLGKDVYRRFCAKLPRRMHQAGTTAVIEPDERSTTSIERPRTSGQLAASVVWTSTLVLSTRRPAFSPSTAVVRFHSVVA